ncbi:MAG: hypothetical protein U1F57_11360 [bacterium]
MKRSFLFFPLLALLFFLPSRGQAQSLQLTIRSLTGAVISGQPGDLRILMGTVDAFGISPNRMGEVHYDPSRRGAFYDVSVEIITQANGGNFSNGQLSVLRTRPFRGNDIPADGLYDADFGVRFGEGADIHLLSDTQPYIIRNDLSDRQTSTQRKIGVFVSEKLPPGRYEGGVLYTFGIP